MTLALVALAPPRPGRLGAVIGVALTATLALSSHVSTALMLGATLVCVAGLFATLAGAELRPAAAGLALALVLAASASFFLYYRHFDEVFVTAWNRVGETRITAPATAEASAESESVAPRRDAGPVSLATRGRVAAREAVRSFGWPVLLLAGLGVFTLRRADLATPLGCLLLAWACVWIGVTGTMVIARVGAEFERYAVEFLGRVNLAVYPLLAVVGARGAINDSVTASSKGGGGDARGDRRDRRLPRVAQLVQLRRNEGAGPSPPPSWATSQSRASSAFPFQLRSLCD